MSPPGVLLLVLGMVKKCLKKQWVSGNEHKASKHILFSFSLASLVPIWYFFGYTACHENDVLTKDNFWMLPKLLILWCQNSASSLQSWGPVLLCTILDHLEVGIPLFLESHGIIFKQFHQLLHWTFSLQWTCGGQIHTFLFFFPSTKPHSLQIDNGLFRAWVEVRGLWRQ